MAKYELSEQELHIVLEGLNKQEQSAKRGQNTTKNPMIKECHRAEEAACRVLTTKLMQKTPQ